VAQVHSLLQASEDKIQRITQQSSSRVEHGKNVAEECSQVFSEVVLNVAKVNSCVGEISSASSENAQGIREITNAMSLIDQTTQRNTSSAQKTSESSEQLTQQAQELRSTVLSLNRIIEGERSKLSPTGS
jgi:methyl-accepting chemotaxis protein